MDLKKKQKNRLTLLNNIAKKKPFKGMAFDKDRNRYYFENQNEFTRLIEREKIKRVYLIETKDPEYNQKMRDHASKIIKDLTAEYPLIVLNGYNLVNPTLEKWYDEEYNIDTLAGLSEDDLEKVKKETTQHINDIFKKAGIVSKEQGTGLKSKIKGGPIIIEPEEGEVKTTAMRL